MNTDNYMELCDVIIAAEKQAAELMMQAHGVMAENKTGRRDVVTEYDRKVQELLMELLKKAVPDAGFFCEELKDQSGLSADRLFIIDPIDGTMNFVHGFNHSCISVAYAEGGRLCAAAVYNPYADEMFSAVLRQGAFLNGKPIQVSDAALKDSVVCFGTSPYLPELKEKTFALAQKMFDASLDLRRQGSAELDLCSVAAGRAGLYFELSVSLWDYAAGALILSEAGGMCCRADGGPLPFDESKTDIVAGSMQTLTDYFQLTLGQK